MTTEQIKTRVRESFEDVDSKEFLELKIKEQLKIHANNFSIWKTKAPQGTLEEWKAFNAETVNLKTTDNSEVLAIGVFLLALDEFSPLKL